MSDVESLLAAFDTGSLLRPSPEIPNLVDLSRALASLAGAEGIESTLGSAGLAKLIGEKEFPNVFSHDAPTNERPASIQPPGTGWIGRICGIDIYAARV